MIKIIIGFLVVVFALGVAFSAACGVFDGDSVSIRDRVLLVIDDLDDNDDADDIEDELVDLKVDENDAERIAEAIAEARAAGVELDDIEDAVDDVDDDDADDARAISRAIRDLEPESANAGTETSATPTAGASSPPAPTPTQAPADTGMTVRDPFVGGGADSACRLDKVGTWSEGNNPHRIEVGGHGSQHFDFYPRYEPRIYSVSYLIDPIANPDGIPDLAFGYGSLWEGDTPNCHNAPAQWWIDDATNYARARLDSGHSGLVIDLRTTPAKVVANLRNLSQQDIETLLADHSAAMKKGERGFEIRIERVTTAAASEPQAQAPVNSSAPPAPEPNRANCATIYGTSYLSDTEMNWYRANCDGYAPYTPPAQSQAPAAPPPSGGPAQPPASSCGDGVRGPDFDPKPGVPWNPGSANSWRVVNFWTNWPGQDQSERKILLEPGNPGNLTGGGSYWEWPANCGEAAQKAFNGN